MDTPRRILVKSMLWTGIGVASMTTVGFLFTGSWSAGGRMALINAAIGFACYLLYEAAWSRIGWGRR